MSNIDLFTISHDNTDSLELNKVKFRNRMGQKSSKSNDFDPKEFDPAKLIKELASSCSSTSSSTSSKSKSNHDSAISNDSAISGCYLGIDSTEKYKDNSSSVSCLFDLTNNNGKLQKSNVLKINNINLPKTKSDLKSRLLKIENYLFLNDEKHENGNIYKIRPSSVCDSILYSCSLASSNIGLNNDDTLPIDKTVNESEDSNKKAQLLCDQLNKILNISTRLASESIVKKNLECETISNANQIKATITSSQSKNPIKKFSNSKTLNFCKNSNISPETNDNLSSSKKITSLFKSKPVNRSHTFHANNFKFESEELNDNSINSAENLAHKEMQIKDRNNIEFTANSKSTISSYLFKNGRRLFSRNINSQKLKIPIKRQILENDPVKISKSTEEKIVNLIAAKLCTENIELGKAPYTDEVGFILISVILIKFKLYL